MVAVVESSHRWRRTASPVVVGVFAALLGPSSAHASAPGSPVDLVAVLVGDGVQGYGHSLGDALDALVADGAVDSAASAPPPDGATRADLLRSLATGSTMAVVVQGAGYGPALAEVATALPDEAFIWIAGDAPTDPATLPAGLPNVSTVYADVAPAAALLGELLADGLLEDVQRLGWTGSSEPSGDDGVFITSLIDAAALTSASVVLTSRLPDVAADLAATDDIVDVLLVSGLVPSELPAPLRIEIAGSSDDDSDEPSAPGARRIVVGYHYEVALTEILAGYEAGELGRTEHHLTLENGGLTLEATDPADAGVLHDALVDAGLAEPVDSSPPTTQDVPAPDATAPASSEPAPPLTTPPAPTSPVPGVTTTTVPATLPPDTDPPDTKPTEPTTAPTTDGPGSTAGETTSTDPPAPTDPPTTATDPPSVTEAPAAVTSVFAATPNG